MAWKLWPSSKKNKQDLEKRGISLLERVIKSTPAVLIGIVLTFFLSRSGIFRQLETYALDTQVRLQGADHDSDVVVVRIDDQDYDNLFHSKSPLDQATLLKIINAIAAGKPRVIGVDIDTTSIQFREMHPPTNGPVIVWARNGSFSHRDGKYHLSALLGGQEPDPTFGVIVMRLDADGAIRRYPQLCATSQGAVPSFPWAVMKAFEPETANRRQPTQDDLFIKFAGDREGSHRQHFTASRILELADGPGWRADSPIKDKVVLLGGAYAADDEHDTPLGWMLGVEVLAYAVETELKGGGLRPASPILVTVLGGFSGLVLLLLFQHFTPPKALLLSLMAIPVLGMISSLFTFKTMAFWAYFVPIPLAVLAQEFYHQAKDYRKKLIQQLYEGVVGKPVEAAAAPKDKPEDAPAIDEPTALPAETKDKIKPDPTPVALSPPP